MTHSPNPIYDDLKREVAREKMRNAGKALAQVAELFKAMGEGYRDGMRKAASGGSSSQAVSADSAPPHSLQDSGRPEGLGKFRERDFEGDVYVDGKLVGKAMKLTVDEGFLPGCTCEPGACTCDVDWDAMAEKRLDQGGF